MRSVILAAGIGKRLRPLTETLPKAFLPLNGKPLIFYSLENLYNVGVRDVLIVTGYLSNKFEVEIGNSFRSNMQIHYVHNPRFMETGSMYSLSQTRDMIDEDILLMESDLLYEQRALEVLLDHPGKDVLLVAPLSGSGDEVYIRVTGQDNLIDLGKDIPEKDKAIGELVGVTKLSPEYLNKVWELAEKDYENGRLDIHYEEVIARVAKDSTVLHCLYLDGLQWIEIDKKSDLQRAMDEILPAILSE